ncbi:hypothetical protein V3C99_003624 [Haemonchus contortus]
MEQEDDETDEDAEFLRKAEKIISDFEKGKEVSHLMQQLKRPSHSYDEDATGCIYEVLEKMITSRDKSTRTPSSSPPPASTPSPIGECSNLDLNQLNGSVKRRLSFSPTMQESERGSNEMNEAPFVPKLDFSLLSSIEHSSPPIPAITHMDSNAFERSLRLGSQCHRCPPREGSLNASDFVYLIIFGIITSLIVYYLHMPPLHKGPVY